MKYHLGFHRSLSEGVGGGIVELFLVLVAVITFIIDLRLHLATLFIIDPSTLSALWRYPFQTFLQFITQAK